MTTDTFEKATELLALLKKHGIVSDDTCTDGLTRSTLRNIGDLADSALESAKAHMAEVQKMVDTLDSLFSDLYTPANFAITDVTEFTADELPTVEKYNGLVVRGVAETLTPAENDQLCNLGEQLGL